MNEVNFNEFSTWESEFLIRGERIREKCLESWYDSDWTKERMVMPGRMLILSIGVMSKCCPLPMTSRLVAIIQEALTICTLGNILSSDRGALPRKYENLVSGLQELSS